MVDVIVQNVSESGSTDISFTMNRDELDKIGDLVDRVARRDRRRQGHQAGRHRQAQRRRHRHAHPFGCGRRSSSSALAKGGINIQMISTSEIKIAVIIDEEKIADAAKLAHTAFGLDTA